MKENFYSCSGNTCRNKTVKTYSKRSTKKKMGCREQSHAANGEKRTQARCPFSLKNRFWQDRRDQLYHKVLLFCWLFFCNTFRHFVGKQWFFLVIAAGVFFSFPDIFRCHSTIIKKFFKYRIPNYSLESHVFVCYRNNLGILSLLSEQIYTHVNTDYICLSYCNGITSASKNSHIEKGQLS